MKSIIFLVSIFFCSFTFAEVGTLNFPADATVYFGGSFSPPTLQHMGLQSYVMNRFKIRKGVISVAFPYKAGAAPAEVSESLTRIAVKNFDEVLALNSEHYSKFHSDDEVTTWQGESGVDFSLSVDTFDIKTQNKSTLKALKYYRENFAGGEANKNFWISGSDSFSSVPTWGDDWQKMFEETNWIVVARPGENSGGVDINAENPLLHAFDKYPNAGQFVDFYKHDYDNVEHVHIYSRKSDPTLPKIYVIDKPMLDDSSSLNRKSLLEDNERAHAQDGLQPSVFRECIEKGYYVNGPLNNQFTVENLKRQLEWTLLRTNLDSSDRTTYQKLAVELVKITDLMVEKERNQVVPVAVISEALTLLENGVRPRALEALFRKWERSLRGNESLLSGVDKKTYDELSSFGNELLRGDPKSIVSRVMINSDMGLDREGLLTNIVQSRLPKWVPLAIRRWDDQKVTWYDLNISTNELRAIINNQAVYAALKKSAGKNVNLLGDLLLTEVLTHDDQKLELEIFLTHRYFKRLSFGDVEPGVLAGFSDREASFISSARSFAQNLPLNSMNPDQINLAKNSLADFFTLTQIYFRHEKMFVSQKGRGNFWTTYIDFISTMYPDQKLSLSNEKQMNYLGMRLSLLKFLINENRDGLFRDVPGAFDIMTYDGKTFMDLRSGQDGFHGEELSRVLLRQEKLEAKSEYRWAFLKDLLSRYVKSHIDYFQEPKWGFLKDATKVDIDFLPLAIDSGVSSKNLQWDLSVFRGRFENQSELLDKGYVEALKYLRSQPHDPQVPLIFADALENLRVRTQNVQNELEVFKFKWLRVRYAYQLNQDETSIPGYDGLLAQYQEIQAQFQGILSGQRAISQMILRRQIVNLNNADEVRSRVSQALKVDGRGFGRSLAQRCADRLRRI